MTFIKLHAIELSNYDLIKTDLQCWWTWEHSISYPHHPKDGRNLIPQFKFLGTPFEEKNQRGWIFGGAFEK